MDDPQAGDPDEFAPDPDEMANQQAMENWEHVVDDMEATASEYEDAGWETLQIHPGDVAVLDGDDAGPGLDVVVPDPEFDDLEAVFESGEEVAETEVFRASLDAMTYLVIAMQHDAGTVVLVPAYYRTSDPKVETAFRRAHAGDGFATRLRRLNNETIVVRHDDPDLFAPESTDDETDTAEDA